MARRKARRTSRRRGSRAFNVKSALFSYLTLNAGTQWVFNNNPFNFLAAGYLPGVEGWQGANRIALKEILQGQTLGYSQASDDLMTNLKANLQNNAPQFILTLIGLKVGQKLLTASGIPRSFNKTTKQLGLGSFVRM